MFHKGNGLFWKIWQRRLDKYRDQIAGSDLEQRKLARQGGGQGRPT